jgi:serine/threonine protein kinase/rhodanese-related sulfurtransferase
LGIKSFFTRSKYKNAATTPSKAVHTPIHHLIGRFQNLKTFHLQHPRLCAYVDAIKGKHNQVFLVSHTYEWSIREVVRQSQAHFTESQIKSIVFQVLDALVFLNSRQIVHRKLTLDNIMIDEQGQVKLADYGMYYITKSGSLVAFPVGDPRTISPEAIAEGIVFSDAPDTPKSDVWSLGILLFELISGGQLPWPQTSNSPFKVLLEILNLTGHDIHIDLQHAKLQDLESSDLEALRIKESGILTRLASKSQVSTPSTQTASSHSNLTSTTSTAGVQENNHANYHFSAKMTPEARERQHAALFKKSKLQLELLVNSTPQFARVSQELRELMLLCLTADPLERCTPAELITHPYFEDMQIHRSIPLFVPKPFTMTDILHMEPGNPLRKRFEEKIQRQEQHKREELEKATTLKSKVKEATLPTQPLSSSSTSISVGEPEYDPETDPVNKLSLAELFHIWCQGSGDIEGELAPELKISPPILRIPLFVRSKDSAAETVSDPDSKLIIQHHGSKDESRRYNDHMVKVATETLAYLAERNSNFAKIPFVHLDRSQWPLEVREKDLEYQAHRIVMFRHLLEFYPETRSQIIREARKDVPPMLRAEIWAAILNVPSATICAKTYAEIDKDSEGPADRQIDLDVPRCHQYHELLSSPEGHYKLKRVLKAWVRYNPNWGYWQGVDSFLAPFLVQNFNNEAMAFWCLQRAVEKFSRNLFDREQSVYLQEHLQIFKQLLSYHDPKLSHHLNEIGFQPALYAIPWFLTLFTQFFALDQIARLWDRVLLSGSQLPFYLAYSMMKQLREIILPLDFNGCILLFSSLPGVDIDAFIREAKIVAQETPSSITEANYKHSTTANSAANSSGALSPNTSAPVSVWQTSTEREELAFRFDADAPPKFNPSQLRIDRWWEHQVPLEELQAELFPRLSVTDLANASNFKFVVLDIRSRDQFEKLALPTAINVDSSPQALASPQLQTELARKLDVHRGAHFVVVGDRINQGKHFANFLVENGVPRVSLLNGGIDALVADIPSLLARSGLPPLEAL